MKYILHAKSYKFKLEILILFFNCIIFLSYGQLKVITMPSWKSDHSWGNAVVGENISVWGAVLGDNINNVNYKVTLKVNNVAITSAPNVIAAKEADVPAFGPSLPTIPNQLYYYAYNHYLGYDCKFQKSGCYKIVLEVRNKINNKVLDSNISFVKVFDSALPQATLDPIRVNMMIDKGLLYLFKNAVLELDLSRVKWYANSTASLLLWGVGDKYLGGTASALIAFENQNHLYSNKLRSDPYADVVSKGLNFLILQSLNTSALPIHADGAHGSPNCDVNGDGDGYYFLSQSNFTNSLGYEAIIMANLNGADATVHTTNGGMKYSKLVQNAIEHIYWNQEDILYRGAWPLVNNTPSSTSAYDGTIEQWPAYTLMLAEKRLGFTSPQWVKDNIIFAYKNNLTNANGGCFATSNTCDQINGNTDIAKTGGMLGAYEWLGMNYSSSPDALNAMNFILSSYNNAYISAPGTCKGGWAGSIYAMHSLKRALYYQSGGSLGVVNTMDYYKDMAFWLSGGNVFGPLPFALNTNSSSKQIPTYGFGQSSNGSWADNDWLKDDILSTSFAIYVLSPMAYKKILSDSITSTAVCLGKGVPLEVSHHPGNNYEWTPNIGMASNKIYNPYVTIDTTRNYIGYEFDNEKCPLSDTIFRIYSIDFTKFKVTPSTVSVCSNSNITLNVTGGGSYTWSPTTKMCAGGTVQDSVFKICKIKATTTYRVIGVKQLCKDTIFTTVNIYDTIKTTGVQPLIKICKGETAFLNANPTGGTPPYSYRWSNNTFLSSISVSPGITTNYFLTVSDASGCSPFKQTIVVQVYPTPTVSVTPSTTTVCNGVSATLTASGATSYVWTTTAITNSISVNPSVKTTYTVTGTDANLCSSTASSVVSVNVIPTITVTPNTSVCTGKTATLTAGGASTYSWSPAAGLNVSTGTTVSATPLTTTTYTVTGTTSGCSSTATTIVTVNASAIIPVTPGDTSICKGDNITLTASGASTYKWAPIGQTTAAITVSPISTTTYVVTGTDASNCQGVTTRIVKVNPLPIVTYTPFSPSICSGASVTLTAGGALSYQWSSGDNTAATTVWPTLKSTYTVTGTDVNKCKNTVNAVVTVNPVPTISVTPAFISICPGGITTLKASGGTTYTWSPALGISATSGTIVLATPTVSTTYTCTGTTLGCSGTATAVVLVNSNALIIITPKDTTICKGDVFKMTASGVVNYKWSPTNATTATITVNAASTTTYTVTGTDASNCPGSASSVVTVNPVPTVTVTPNTATVCNGMPTTLTASGAPNYKWNDPVNSTTTSITVSPIIKTTYTVTGTDNNSCKSTASAVITVNTLPTVTVNPTNISICKGSPTNLTAGGASTYSWSPAAGLSATTGATVSANPTATTTYTVTGTALNGCQGTATVVVNVWTLPIVNVADASMCAGGTSTLTAIGANTYTWLPVIGLTPTTGAVVNSNVGVTTTYTVTGTDGNGCKSTDQSIVTVYPLPTVSISPVSVPICLGSSTTLIAGGASSYVWSPTVSLSLSTGTNVTANPTITTIYTVTGTDLNGCSKAATATVTVNPVPTVTVTANSAICSNSSKVLTAGGVGAGGTYTWFPATGLTATTGATVTATPIVTTTYTVTGTTSLGCSATATTVVTVNLTASIFINPKDPSICKGKTITLKASGGVSYKWNTGSIIDSIIVTPPSTATYTVTGTDGNGCTGTTTSVVTVNTLPTITVTPAVTVCSGSFTTLAAGGATSYIWSDNNQTGTPITVGPVGVKTTYTVTGTDNNGCVNTTYTVVSVNPVPTVTVTASGSICSGSCKTLNAGGAGVGGSYVWSPASGLNVTIGAIVSACPTITTVYTVTGTSALNCSATVNVTVTVNPAPTIVVPAPIKICKGDFTTIILSGATSYNWSPGTGLNVTTGDNVTANPTVTTTYTITGYDAIGCSNTAYVIVTVNPLPAVAVNPTSVSICEGKSTALIVNGASTYVWSPTIGLTPSTGANVTASPTVTTVYTVTGTDANTCTNIATVTVTVNPVPIITLSPTTLVKCVNSPLTIIANGATTYNWSPGGTLSSTTGVTVISNTTVTTAYTVTGTSGAGCSSILPFTVTVNAQAPIQIIPSSPKICIGGSVVLTATGGTANNYIWSTGETTDFITVSPVTTTIYSVTGSDANSCFGSATVTVTVNPLPNINITPANPSICNGKTTTLIASGASTYMWSPPAGLNVTTGATVIAGPTLTTTYTVTGTDANSCVNTTYTVVTVNPLPNVTIGINPNPICMGSPSTLTGGGGTTYSWSP